MIFKSENKMFLLFEKIRTIDEILYDVNISWCFENFSKNNLELINQEIEQNNNKKRKILNSDDQVARPMQLFELVFFDYSIFNKIISIIRIKFLFFFSLTPLGIHFTARLICRFFK